MANFIHMKLLEDYIIHIVVWINDTFFIASNRFVSLGFRITS
jgi:hypothetical protein